jgi:glutamine amidotransferase
MGRVCRLFGMSAGAERARASFWLLDAPDSLTVQSHRDPDGTGLGWFEDAAPRISKQPIAAYGDADFARTAQEVSSRTFVAHVRFASTGSLTPRNTHPFQQHGRLFAHNGVIEDLQALELRLGPASSLLEGDTDSERLFALITSETQQRGGDLAEGIAAACAWVAENLPLLAINFVLITPDELWALRYPETHGLFVLERPAGSELEHSSSLGMRVRSKHGAAHPLAVVASERMDSDPAWRELRSGELLRVGPQLQVSSRQILQGPPAHPLRLSDLGARAQASQASQLNSP